MTHPFVTRLSQGVMLCDGAMGTVIHDRGVPIDACFDELNLTHGTMIVEIHRAYIAAGAEIIETNTFGGNRFRLGEHNLADRVRDVNLRGAKLAREAREVSGQPVFVAGSIGPTGRTVEPIGTARQVEVRDAFREQVDALLEGGVDLLMIETISSLDEMQLAVEAARQGSDLPVVAQMTFADDGRTMGGNTVGDVLALLSELGVEVIGVNCSVGPRHTVDVLKELTVAGGPGLHYSGQPNAGFPAQMGNRVMYPSSAEYFAEYAREAAGLGLSIIGGCCGTTPHHTRAMRDALDQLAHAEPSGSTRPAITVLERPESSPSYASEGPTLLAQKLGREFVISVEVDPPKGLNPTKTLAGAKLLKDSGVEFINVADSPMARVRMSALTLCYLIQHQVGIETILHFTTRDRNLMGLQSDLIGAHAVGVRNIIALTGDPPSLGDYPDATPVYDVDSVGLVRVIKKFNAGTDSAGSSIGQEASFTVAVAADPTRPDLEEEADRLSRKISNGGDLVMTQPVFDYQTWIDFLQIYERKYGPIPVPVLLGVLPLQSTRHAEFLHNEVPGIRLTETARERMRLAGNKGRAEGVKLAQELILQSRESVHGIYIMPSFGRYEVAAETASVITDRSLPSSLSHTS
jgi:methionine synthase / methylenetetrahydrofolate reductase(NADPH)